MRAIEIRDAPVRAVVVRVRQHVGQRRRIVHRARERVADAGMQAVGHTPLHADLQAMILRPAGVFGDADRAVAKIRSQRIGVHTRVGLDGSRLQLVDVALPLIVQSAAADVSDFDRRVPGQLALDRHIPVPGKRHVEDGVLRRDDQWEVAPGRAARGIDGAVDDDLLQLEGRVAAKRGVAVDHRAVVEQPESGAERRLWVDGVGETETRLKHVPVRLRETGGQTVSQTIEFAAGPFIARDHHAVERIATARDEPARTIDLHGFGGVVVLRVEHRELAVAAVPLWPERVAHAGFDRDLRRSLPAVLGKDVERGRHPPRRRLGAEFGVVVEVAE